MIRTLQKDGTILEQTDYEYYTNKYGKKNVDRWINEVQMEDLMDCMSAFSNSSFTDFRHHHRDMSLNILEMILQETPNHLYPSVTYGVAPNTVCTDAIGYLTGRKYGNIEIAVFLIQTRIKDLKKWLLNNHHFTDDEKRLLHYFKKQR